MAGEKDFMNVSDAAALLGVHIQTLRKLARQKKIPAFKVGRDWRFRREALVQWADAQHLDEGHNDERCSVLIVDDDEKVCRGLGRVMERFDCRVRLATEGKEGLRLIREMTPDLVLLDLVMPGMTGPQFLKELRKTYPTLPVVIVTGFPHSDLVKEATPFAPLMLLAKPVEPALLERTVRMAVGEKLAQGATR